MRKFNVLSAGSLEELADKLNEKEREIVQTSSVVIHSVQHYQNGEIKVLYSHWKHEAVPPKNGISESINKQVIQKKIEEVNEKASELVNKALQFIPKCDDNSQEDIHLET